MNAQSLRKYLLISEFDYHLDTESWHGPNGLVLSDAFLTDMDDFHTSHAIDQVADAVESGASHIMAHFVSDRPLRVKVEWN